MRGYSHSLPFILLNKMEDAVLAIDHNFVITFLNLHVSSCSTSKRKKQSARICMNFFRKHQMNFVM